MTGRSDRGTVEVHDLWSDMTPPASDPLILCYDGSADSKRAIKQAGAFFDHAQATVVTAWHRTPGLGSPGLDHHLADEASATASEGVACATEVGLAATPVALEVHGPVWQAISDLADRQNAACIVVGSRGNTGLRSVMLGSVSTAVVQHSHHPTLVVHSDDRRGDLAPAREEVDAVGTA